LPRSGADITEVKPGQSAPGARHTVGCIGQQARRFSVRKNDAGTRRRGDTGKENLLKRTRSFGLAMQKHPARPAAATKPPRLHVLATLATPAYQLIKTIHLPGFESCDTPMCVVNLEPRNLGARLAVRRLFSVSTCLQVNHPWLLEYWSSIRRFATANNRRAAA
jgi:hypothetical protein